MVSLVILKPLGTTTLGLTVGLEGLLSQQLFEGFDFF